MWWEIPSRVLDRPSMYHQGSSREAAIEGAKKVTKYPDTYDWDNARPANWGSI